MPARSASIARLALTLSLLLSARAAHATWPHDPAFGNVPICLAPIGSQSTPVVASDGAGGMIVAWVDGRSGATFDIYAQRISASGVPLWTTDGVPVVTGPGDQTYPTIISDGAGGAIIAWTDTRSSSQDIFAQRLNGSGTPLWTANGIVVCAASGTQGGTVITSDGAGGAIIAWHDLRSTANYDIYAQRVNSSGTPLWIANGVAVCTAAADQTNPVITSDGVGGAYIAWNDLRGGTYDIYAQRLNGSGTALGTANGVVMSNAASDQVNSVIAPDGAGGAFLAWADYRSGAADIYAQHVWPDLSVGWANGVAVCTATGTQQSAAITADGTGGVIMAWSDYRNSGIGDIYATRMNWGGPIVWTSNGVPVCTANDNQVMPLVIADGAGGAIIAWSDNRVGNFTDIYAQRVNASGSTLWNPNGVPITTAANIQNLTGMVSDGNAGALIVWSDNRSYTASHIYGQRVEHFGYIGSPEPVMAGVRDIPNDQGGKVRVAWYASYLDSLLDPNLAAYDVYRSTPASGAMMAAAHGTHVAHDFGSVPTAGTIVLRAESPQLYAWEYRGTVTPNHVTPVYGFVDATLSDSLPGSNPRTAFMVVARNAGATMNWASLPDSGYSVDNIPPAAPAPFAGAYAGGSTAMHWHADTDADLAGYRLYRSANAGFVPSPGNLVASPTDTSYTDASGQPFYYKLSAVDIHGNESGFTLLMPNGTTAVGGGPALELALAGAVPNPAVGFAEICFTLPREARASVRILDASGRLVRELSRSQLSAGSHALRWDGLRGDGSPAAPGLYFVRLETEGRALTRRMALMR